MLQSLLPIEAFGFLLILCRIGSALMLIPGIGEIYVSPQIRLGLAFAIALLIAPFIGANLPALPGEPLRLFFMVLNEILIGVFIGGAARLAISSLQVAGTVVAFQSSLGFGTFFDPTQGQQGALVATFFSMLGLMLIFAADLHLLMLRACIDSYQLFPPDRLLPMNDFAALAAELVAGSFKVGIQIAAPFIVYGLVFNIGLGAINRLMPSMQVMFIAMPLQIMLAFLLLIFSLGASMIWFLDYYEGAVSAFLVR